MTGTIPSLPSMPTMPRMGLAGGGGPAAVEFDVVVNFSSGSGALDAIKMNAGTHGANWGTWHDYHDGIEDDPNLYSNIEDHEVTFPVDLDVGGTLYGGPTGTQGQGMTFDFT